MKIENAKSQALNNSMQMSTAMALPFKFMTHLFAIVIDLLINVPVMNTVWQERRELRLLTHEHLKDIGLTSDCIRQEMNRSYFDIPHERKRSYRSANTARHSKPGKVSQTVVLQQEY